MSPVHGRRGGGDEHLLHIPGTPLSILPTLRRRGEAAKASKRTQFMPRHGRLLGLVVASLLASKKSFRFDYVCTPWPSDAHYELVGCEKRNGDISACVPPAVRQCACGVASGSHTEVPRRNKRRSQARVQAGTGFLKRSKSKQGTEPNSAK